MPRPLEPPQEERRRRKGEGTGIVAEKAKRRLRVASAAITGIGDAELRAMRTRRQKMALRERQPAMALLTHPRRLRVQQPLRLKRVAATGEGVAIKRRIKIRIGRKVQRLKKVRRRRKNAAVEVASVVAATREMPKVLPLRMNPGTSLRNKMARMPLHHLPPHLRGVTWHPKRGAAFLLG